MQGKGDSTGSRSGARAGLLIASCVTLLALPSAVLAFSASFNVAASDNLDKTADPAIDSRALLGALSIHSGPDANPFPFTPAGTRNESDRSVTVAVRVDGAPARAITVRGPIAARDDAVEPGNIRIAPTAFNLGVSRGYRNFAQSLVREGDRTVSATKTVGQMPDMKKFKLTPGVKEEESRFSPLIAIDDNPATGRSPRTFAGDSGELDVGGAYRVSDNIDLTAGVRYSQERERIVPVTDGRQDAQAVYVGTQFHF